MYKLRPLIAALSILLCAHFSASCAEEKLDFAVSAPSFPAIATVYEGCYLGSKGSLVLVLSDGSQWNLQEDAYATLSKTWKEGDDIRLKKHHPRTESNQEFIVKNVRTQDMYLAQLNPECADMSRAYFIHKIDRNGYALVTHSGLKWAIGWLGSFKTSRWHPEDRVIINKSSHAGEEDYCLINARDGSSCWASLIIWK